MRGAFCLLCLRVFLCQSNINIQAGEFDNFPTTPPDGGQWVDAVLHADKGYYDLTGISDVIVGEEELQSFVKTKQYDYGLGNCLYITGTEQQNYPNPNVRRERIILQVTKSELWTLFHINGVKLLMHVLSLCKKD